jgi:hypothetical protein
MRRNKKMRWINGKPPDSFEDLAWIIIEVPSLFSQELKRYTTVRWMGDSWSNKEVNRATRWAKLELPEKEE